MAWRFSERVSTHFTVVTGHEAEVRRIVTELLDAALAKDEVEIVGELASVLPARMIGRLLGFPDEAWPRLRDWSEETIMLDDGSGALADGRGASPWQLTAPDVSVSATTRAGAGFIA